MSIFLDKENEKIIQEEEESNEENKFISYYNKLFPNVEPLALYKNTKFVTINKIKMITFRCSFYKRCIK